MKAITRRAFLRGGALWLGAASAASITDFPVAADDRGKKPRLRIGLLTDVHYANKETAGTRWYRESLAKVREAVSQFKESRIDFSVQLGDFVDSAETEAEELEALKRIEAEYAGYPGERHHVLGNHCVWTLTKQLFFEATGSREAHYSFDRGGFHFVVLDACYRADGVPYGKRNFQWTDTEVPPEEREWLARDLEAAGGKAIVFIHQRLDVEGDYSVKSAPAVRKILERSGKVLAVFQGHYHENDRREIAGIHYVTLAALVEGTGSGNNAHGILDVFEDGSLKLEGFGRQRDCSLEAPTPSRRIWV